MTVECLAPPRAPLGQRLSESRLIPIVDPSLPPHGENPHSLRPSLPLSTRKLLVPGTEPPQRFPLNRLVRGGDNPLSVSGLLRDLLNCSGMPQRLVNGLIHTMGSGLSIPADSLLGCLVLTQ